MFAVVVSDDVGVSKRGKNGELGMKLFTFLLRHAQVIDFLATEDLSILLPANFPDDSKRSMSYKD